MFSLSGHYTYSKLIKAVLPTIGMMVFLSIYSIIDGIFVSNFVGNSAFAGLNLIFPVTMAIGSIGFMFGTGGSALVSKTLGEGNNKKAKEYFSLIIYSLIVIGIVVSIGLFFLIEPITNLMASFSNETSQEMINEAIKYGRIIALGETFFMLQNVFQNFFVVNEKPHLSFIVTLICGLCNIAFDALFIIVFKWGIIGAATATISAQAIGAIIPIIYFINKNRKIHFSKCKFEIWPLLKTMVNGSSELLSNISASIVGIFYNVQLLALAGENGVSAYGIILYIQFIFISIYIGYSVGVAPIVGYNFGAKNHDELRNIRRKSLLLMFIFGVLMVLTSNIFADPLCQLFSSGNEELLKMSITGLRIFSISFIITGINIFTSSFFTALNDGLTSAVLSTSRTLVFQVISILILPIFFQLTGVWISITVAEFCSTLLCVGALILFKKKYNY